MPTNFIEQITQSSDMKKIGVLYGLLTDLFAIEQAKEKIALLEAGLTKGERALLYFEASALNPDELQFVLKQLKGRVRVLNEQEEKKKQLETANDPNAVEQPKQRESIYINYSDYYFRAGEINTHVNPYAYGQVVSGPGKCIFLTPKVPWDSEKDTIEVLGTECDQLLEKLDEIVKTKPDSSKSYGAWLQYMGKVFLTPSERTIEELVLDLEALGAIKSEEIVWGPFGTV